jgi:hypothetical protein
MFEIWKIYSNRFGFCFQAPCIAAALLNFCIKIGDYVQVYNSFHSGLPIVPIIIIQTSTNVTGSSSSLISLMNFRKNHPIRLSVPYNVQLPSRYYHIWKWISFTKIFERILWCIPTLTRYGIRPKVGSQHTQPFCITSSERTRGILLKDWHWIRLSSNSRPSARKAIGHEVLSTL